MCPAIFIQFNYFFDLGWSPAAAQLIRIAISFCSILKRVTEELWVTASSSCRWFDFIRLMKPANTTLSRKCSKRVLIWSQCGRWRTLSRRCRALALSRAIGSLQISWEKLPHNTSDSSFQLIDFKKKNAFKAALFSCVSSCRAPSTRWMGSTSPRWPLL